jgi:thiosulfate reductase cytochrome b subunit
VIFAWIKARALLVLGVISLVGAALLRVRQSGKQAEQNKQLKDTIKAIRKKEEVQREVDRLGDGDAAKRLRDVWTRD